MNKCGVCETSYDPEAEDHCPVCGPADRTRGIGYAPPRAEHVPDGPLSVFNLTKEDHEKLKRVKIPYRYFWRAWSKTK